MHLLSAVSRRFDMDIEGRAVRAAGHADSQPEHHPALESNLEELQQRPKSRRVRRTGDNH